MKNKNYDKKIFRLVSILNKLNGGGKVRSSVLAEEFNVSIRSVQRDLDLLNLTGFPLDTPEKGVYSFMQGFSLRKLMLTNEEASLLTFSMRSRTRLGRTSRSLSVASSAKSLPGRIHRPSLSNCPRSRLT